MDSNIKSWQLTKVCKCPYFVLYDVEPGKRDSLYDTKIKQVAIVLTEDDTCRSPKEKNEIHEYDRAGTSHK